MAAVTVTFDPNPVPSEKMFRFSPDPCHVAHGTHTVTWTLSSPNAPGAAFSPADANDPSAQGVYFAANSSWPDAQPTPVGASPTVYQVTDVNRNSSRKGVKYGYGVNVTYDNQNYHQDPEIENDPPGNVVFE